MALTAGLPSEVDAETIASSMGQALEGGRLINANPDEVFALVSQMAVAFSGHGESTKSSGAIKAGDRLKALGTRIFSERPDLRDKGFLGAFEAFEVLDKMSDEERSKILKKDQETNAAFMVMKEFMPQIKAVRGQVAQARIETGTDKDTLERMRSAAMAVPDIAAQHRVGQARVREEIAREQATAGFEGNREIAQRNAAVSNFQAGVSPVGRQTTAQLSSWFGWMGAGAESAAGRIGASVPVAEDVADIIRLLTEIRDQGASRRPVVADGLQPLQ
jgi:hypothetical protein